MAYYNYFGNLNTSEPLTLESYNNIPNENPVSVQEALKAAVAGGEPFPLTEQQIQLDAQMAALGVKRIQNLFGEKCPLGPPSWIFTKSPWLKCEEKLGMRWRTPEGLCYPEGVCGIEHATDAAAGVATLRKVELLQLMIKAINATRIPAREVWLQKRSKDIIRMQTPFTLGAQKYTNKKDDTIMPEYFKMNASQQKAFIDAVTSQMPQELRYLPSQALIQQQQEDFAALKAEAKKRSTAVSSEAEIKKLVEVLRRLGDKVDLKGKSIEDFAKEFITNSKKCASTTAGLPRDKANAAIADNTFFADKCASLDLDTEVVGYPKELESRFKALSRVDADGDAVMDAAATEAQDDALTQWFTDLYAAERVKQARKLERAKGIFSKQ